MGVSGLPGAQEREVQQSAWAVWDKVKRLEKVAEHLHEPLAHGVDKGESAELREAIDTLSIADMCSPNFRA